MAEHRARNGSEPEKSKDVSREESLRSREVAVEARDQQVRAEERTAAKVRLELDGLMSALREASALLAAADRRSQSLVEQLTRKPRREANGLPAPPAHKPRKKR